MAPNVRVRFAPSPTGPLHVGGLRTALYNYLFARRHGGVFVLRIEDTDRTRLIPGVTEKQIESLRWSGLTFHEGPGVGGPHAPYFQSERLEHYRAAAEHLLALGNAYHCFCTPERLDEMRKAQIARKQPFKYDRTCLGLGTAEIEARLGEGSPHTIRLRVPVGEEIAFTDIVRGQVVFSGEQIDDQVLIKSDGFPTYHLANVVDDHDMGITHVIRGEEWLSSTPKHVLLYRFLGYELPEFAHLPLLLNPDRSKLSKRQGDVAVEDYRAQHYLPEALINFVAFLGWNPGDERELFTLDELVDAFSLERVNKAGAIFNIEKLRWFNQEYLRRKPTSELVAELRPLLAARGWRRLDDNYLARVIDLMRGRMTFVGDLADLAPYFFEDPAEYDPATVKKRWKPESPELLSRLLPRLPSLEEWNGDTLEETVRHVAEETGQPPGALIHPLRLAVSGTGAGPGLYELLATLGRDASVRRIRRAIDALGQR